MQAKLPPQDLEAEKSILGSLMIDNYAITKVADVLAPADFYSSTNKKIYQITLDLFQKSQPIDIVSVTNILESRKQLSDVGGSSYLTDLINTVPSSAHIAHYAKLVKEKRVLRDLIAISAEINERVFDDTSEGPNLIDEIEQKLFSVSQTSHDKAFVALKDELSSAYDRIEKLHQGERGLRGVTTGYQGIDHYLSGLQPSDLIILGARPSLGKTTLALDMARSAAKKGKVPVGIFSLEMSREQIVDRLISTEAQVSLWKLRTGRLNQDSDFELIQHALGTLSDVPIYIDDTPSPNIMQIRSIARRLQSEHGLGLVVVDYVQLIHPLRPSDNTVQQFTEISHGLKALARELNVPVLALSQLNRSVDQREHKVPRLSDLRETGCLCAESLVYNPVTGASSSIKDIAEGIIPQQNVLSVDEHWRSLSQPVVKAFWSGKKRVYKLTTRSGRTVRASANHPFLTLEGWTRLDKLITGDAIALPRITPEPTEPQKMDENEIVLLSHLLGDGCYVKKQPLHYTNNDPLCLDVVEASANKRFSIAPKRVQQESWWHTYLTNSEKKSSKNPVIDWLKELGIYGQRSYEKEIPQAISRLSNKQLALFVSHLWATDGTVYLKKNSSEKKQVVIQYTSSSERLIRSLQSLLLRFGIISSIALRQRKNFRPWWDLSIQSAPMQTLFLKNIGVYGRKSAVCKEALELLKTIETNPNNDVLPLGVWNIIKKEKGKEGIGWREFTSRLGVSYCGSTLFSRRPGREKTLAIATKCLPKSIVINDLATSDIYWDPVVSIEKQGIEDVYDISVQEPHNFLANDIFVHNSWEQDADVVMLIYRKDKDKLEPSLEEENSASIIIAKHRNGPIGTVEMKFDAERVTFREVDTRHNEEPL
jgi:replicative DNA helicase